MAKTRGKQIASATIRGGAILQCMADAIDDYGTVDPEYHFDALQYSDAYLRKVAKDMDNELFREIPVLGRLKAPELFNGDEAVLLEPVRKMLAVDALNWARERKYGWVDCGLAGYAAQQAGLSEENALYFFDYDKNGYPRVFYPEKGFYEVTTRSVLEQHHYILAAKPEVMTSKAVSKFKVCPGGFLEVICLKEPIAAADLDELLFQERYSLSIWYDVKKLPVSADKPPMIAQGDDPHGHRPFKVIVKDPESYDLLNESGELKAGTRLLVHRLPD